MKRLHPSLVLLLAAPSYGYACSSHSLVLWDDMPMSWIRYELGPEAMARSLSTNRPAMWGLLYQVTRACSRRGAGVTGRFLRCSGALAGGAGCLGHWCANCGRQTALRSEHRAVFLLYPGFQPAVGSYLYSHFFIVLLFSSFHLP